MLDLQVPDVLHRLRGVPERGLQAFACDLRIGPQHVFRTCAASEQLENELHADTRAANTGLSTEHVRLGLDPRFGGCFGGHRQKRSRSSEKDEGPLKTSRRARSEAKLPGG